MKSLLVALCLCICVNAFARKQASNIHHLDKQWEEFKLKFHKHYDTSKEEAKRRLIWKATLEAVEKHNQEYQLGLHSYTKGINKFSDLTKEEFKRKYTGLTSSRKPQRFNLHKVTNETLPDSVDWRSKGYVTPVKDQDPCGSCWAFSTTGALEGQYYRFSKNLVSFSEQQLMDCSRSYGNSGCYGKGGDPIWALEYIKKYGIENDTIYPYVHEDTKCAYNPSNVIVKVRETVYLPEGDEMALKHAVATVGPISVSIAAEDFGTYDGGIYNDLNCTKEGLDHGVLVVGYGRQNGQDYWLVKNSWGTDFGEDGYIKMSRNKNDQCGIASHAFYPLLKK